MAASRSATARKRALPSLRSSALVLGLLAIGIAGWWWSQRDAAAAVGAYRTATVESGDLRVAISATGTLAAISTVDVGSQISGQVTDVLVDFNDRVRRDQVIARIDPSTYQAQIAQGSAAVSSARANLATAKATLANAEVDYKRKAELVGQQLIARSDVDLAKAARDQALAQVAAAQAQITQQQASTQTSQLNLERTVIRSPVDGVVLTRSIEPGQTVAASLQAPVLFQIAEDLSKMEIVLQIDEADIGQVKSGQGVNFTVDAFPDRAFRGKVQQVRLSATNTNNVITYPVVVSVDNADGVLLPGMTANAEIEVSRRDDVLKVPNAALRFKPADDAAPADGAQAQPRGSLAGEVPKLAQSLQLNPTQQAAFDDALKQMRERMAARMAPTNVPQGGGSALFGRGPGGGPGAGNGNSGGDMSGAMRQRMQERFNQQFAAFRATLDAAQQGKWDAGVNALVGARRAPVYKLVDGQPRLAMVRIGVSDGTNTEVSGDIAAGDAVIVGAQRAAQPKAAQ
ncbi:efflux RND transporter periplasmic adaptor subunit [Lysobacter sp. A6]|uniref:Efflux RND transporter periplasmic adaptor subunit n=1 Tax=Noviluteimonas lactosilytica TaxID=2888523 RepID=A0ABS8JKH7_9GAMM|nr:efflux RND transporter periplasmic adaptor subunit [Lysobacter lactosilyticus]MCC8364116.1 efflux RND transporter periplasmic adaptor subunit [Lysobacter lactosilyticus]